MTTEKLILVADDEPIVRGLICTALQDAGHGVSEVNSGREAYQLLTTCRDTYKLAIMDICMPEYTGLEALELVRGFGVKLPIILITGLSAQNVPCGVPFLLKPFTVAELNAKVAEALKE